MKSTHEWSTSTGLKVTATAALITSETAYADGYNIDLPCCKQDLYIDVEGMGRLSGFLIRLREPRTLAGFTALATYGPLAISADNLAGIDRAIAEIEATPEWQAKVAKEAAATKADAEYHDRLESSGCCPKCGTWCHGECGK